MQRVDNDLEFLEETISMLNEDSPGLLRQIQDAAARGDADAIVGPAHTLKGMLANFCAARAETAARDVEIVGRENRMTNVDATVTALERETERLRDALHEFLEDHRS
jgi:HPt (histidine-containing phosphotransfer) domain-containing protein